MISVGVLSNIKIIGLRGMLKLIDNISKEIGRSDMVFFIVAHINFSCSSLLLLLNSIIIQIQVLNNPQVPGTLTILQPFNLKFLPVHTLKKNKKIINFFTVYFRTAFIFSTMNYLVLVLPFREMNNKLWS